MASTHLSLHYHLVFSTKDRVPCLGACWRDRLHAYLGGIASNLGAVPEAIGGVADHVHLLVGLRATHTLSDVVCSLKSCSSLWIHQARGLSSFAWQEGYGAFTVSASHRQKVVGYINNQEEHHRQKTFQEEYVALLRKSGVTFRAEYLW